MKEAVTKVIDTLTLEDSSMGPSRNYWIGTTGALQPEEVTSKGTRVLCVSVNIFNDPRIYIYIYIYI